MYYVDNYISHGDRVFLVSISGGQSPYYTRGYGGVRLQTAQLCTYKNYGLDVIGSLWCQPRMQQNADDRVEDKNYWGGLIGIENRLKLGNYFALHASIIRKKMGFVEGIIDNGGYIIQAGFSLRY